MEEVFFTIKMENLNTMDNGEMIFMMDGVLYTHREEAGRNMKENLEME
jgi:tartrate dehydratase beta subunit/fumarate hydratase class I family protein